MHFSEEDVNRIVGDIWTSVLDTEIELVAQGVMIPRERRSMVGCIQFAGAWEGSVSLFFTELLGYKAAAAMLEMKVDEISETDVQDVLGELTNMIAGNLNTLLPPGGLISLPSVVEGIDYRITVPGGRVACQLGYMCEGEPMRVSIMERI